MDEDPGLDEQMPNPPPRKGDVLFRDDLPDWHNNACLTGANPDNSFAYVEGYRRAAEILAQYVDSTGSDQDFLVYPIIFLYRHHLELAMKRIIKRSPHLLDRHLTTHEAGQLKGHSLDGLWQALKPLIVAICKALGWTKPTRADIEGADDYFRQLLEIDPSATAFRYAQAQDGTDSLPKSLQRINVRHFALMISRLVQYIDDIDTAISVLHDWHSDMKAEYEF